MLSVRRRGFEATALPGSAYLGTNLLAPSIAGQAPSSGFLFHDDFTSGDRTHTENGVAWVGSHNTSVVPYGSGYALRFRYSDPNSGSSYAEQRFSLGAFYEELWMKWRLVIPSNFFHPTDGNDNNKFFRLWDTSYTSFAVKFGASLLPATSGSGESRLLPEWGTDTDGIGSNGSTIANNAVVEADYGQEVEFVFHAKVDTLGTPGGASAATGGNGVLQIWKNGTRIVNHTTVKNRPSAGTNAFGNGYCLGADNTDYANGTEITDFFIPEFWLALTNVFGVS